MLDQNTDRMWYVIGAVLIGATIILIANGSLPQLFASVTDSFEGVTEEALQGVNQIDQRTMWRNKNLILSPDVQVTNDYRARYPVNVEGIHALAGEKVRVSYEVRATHPISGTAYIIDIRPDSHPDGYKHIPQSEPSGQFYATTNWQTFEHVFEIREDPTRIGNMSFTLAVPDKGMILEVRNPSIVWLEE